MESLELIFPAGWNHCQAPTEGVSRLEVDAIILQGVVGNHENGIDGPLQ